MTTAERVSKARKRLINHSAFIGSLSVRLQAVADDSVETWQTDGTVMKYNPAWTDEASDAELMTLWGHETWHCALGHPFDMGKRDQAICNRAMDYVVNLLLDSDGFDLPKTALIDKRFAGLNWKQVYAILEAEKQDGQPQPEPQPGGVQSAPEPQTDDTGNGQAENGGQPQPAPLSAVDWQIASEQAALVGMKAGNVSADMRREVTNSHQASVPWYEITREFFIKTVATDYSMSRPNKQYAARGLYVPSLVKENAPPFVLGVDTSGSISQAMLNRVASEIQALVREIRPESITVVYCDYDVKHVETFGPDDDIRLTVHGGGGTRFQPVFDYVAGMDEQPGALIYFTDLEGDEPAEPEYPVLWLTPEQTDLVGPFGDTVRFSLYD